MSSREHPTVEAAKVRANSAPRERLRARGVVHTPMALARFGLTRVDRWLRDELGLARGLADPRALVLDPAVGTGVWLAAALELGQDATTAPQSEPAARSMWGFDVDQEALDTSHALLRAELERQRVQLTLRCENTLGIADPWPSGRAGVRVIVGNPPWAARSLSRGTVLSDAWLDEFRRDADGIPLGERRVGVLSDDYVRFFRWTLEQARKAPDGAVFCLASNGSFLDGPVHRGMRAALRGEFDRIEVVDLGGNALLSRGRERDENVFGVRVGAALTLALRLPHARERMACVRVGRVTGSRQEKLEKLDELVWEETATEGTAPWKKREGGVKPAPNRRAFSLADAFPFHREGLQTNRDEIATAATRDELWTKLSRIADGHLRLSASAHFDPERARSVARAVLAGEHGECIRRLAYRPLETRIVCAVAPLCHRPRPDLLRATACSPLTLLSARKDRGHLPFALFGAATDVADACFLSTRSSCRTRVFPSHTPEGAPNLSGEVGMLFANLGAPSEPEQVILYALGVLCSARFRDEQGDSLKHDYPRVPVPASAQSVMDFCAAGQHALDALHPDFSAVASSDECTVTSVGEEEAIDLRRVCFSSSERKLTNGSQSLVIGVSPELWQCTIGHIPWRRLAAPKSAEFSQLAGAAGKLLPPGHVWKSDLTAVLRRGECWLHAREQADRAFLRHFS